MKLFGLIRKQFGRYSDRSNESERLEESMNAEDSDRTEWDSAWSSMESRNVERISDLDGRTLFKLDLGPALSATVSRMPAQYIERMYFGTSNCPLCLMPANDPDTRYAASLSVEFERLGLAAGVWVHRECFEKLEVSDKPSPIPW
jgi:hypothetical protein